MLQKHKRKWKFGERITKKRKKRNWVRERMKVNIHQNERSTDQSLHLLKVQLLVDWVLKQLNFVLKSVLILRYLFHSFAIPTQHTTHKTKKVQIQ
jgi:hypothetical protein